MVTMKNNTGKIIDYLREVYKKDPLIANLRVLRMVRKEFPKTKARQETVNVWKCTLRNEGIAIPYQRPPVKGAENGKH